MLLAAVVGLASTLPAQLAGTYTVGPTGTYANMAAAITALTTSGVAAPVTFVVSANDTGPWTIGAFAGQGPANPVTFDGQGLVTISGGQPVLTLNGCASVTMRGFRGTFSNSTNAILINAGTVDCVFTGCDFQAPVTTSGGALGVSAVINFAGGSGCRVEDSTFGGGYESIYSGVGNSTTTVQRCHIIGGGWWIMRLAGSDFHLVNNFITGVSNYGISGGVSGQANGPNLKILHNSVYIAHPSAGSQYCSLRWYSSAAGTEVVDNIFYDFYPTTGVFNMWCSGSLRPAVMDFNCLWSNIAGYTPVYAGANQTLASWQALGFDINSFQADPMFVAPGGTPADLTLQPGSPCASSGTTLPTVLDDIFGTPRTPPVSIGAHESSNSGGVFASHVTYGSGCYRTGASFYEVFSANTFDLANSSILMLPTGNGYVVTGGSGGWFTPTSANLALADNQVSPARTLPFMFSYPGGSTTQIWISSNGFVWLAASTDSACCNGTASALLSGLPRLCALWGDLNPGAGGTVHFDVDPITSAAYVTFNQVPETGLTATNTFQIMLDPSGMIELRFQGCSASNHTLLTGFSPGGGALDLGNRDLSSVVTTPIVTNPDQLGLAIDALGRPVTGTTIQLATTNVPPTSIGVGATILGLMQLSPPLDLSLFGMPGCYQHTGLGNINVFVAAGGTASMPLSIPNNPALQGLHVFAQSVAFAAGANPLGMVSSNGVDLRLGNL